MEKLLGISSVSYYEDLVGRCTRFKCFCLCCDNVTADWDPRLRWDADQDQESRLSSICPTTRLDFVSLFDSFKFLFLQNILLGFMFTLTLARDNETFDKKSIDRLFWDFNFHPGIKRMKGQCTNDSVVSLCAVFSSRLSWQHMTKRMIHKCLFLRKIPWIMPLLNVAWLQAFSKMTSRFHGWTLKRFFYLNNY